jgi:three-Cys-motif partner protein
VASNFFDEPFDDETKVKLNIYRAYFREWLPVWIKNGNVKINIYDFFAGRGCDSTNTSGSPLIAIEETEPFSEEILENGLQVNLRFNELNKRNYLSLKKLVEPRKGLVPFSIEVYRKDFKVLFKEQITEMRSCANLLFIDQFGIKQVTPDLFKLITELRQTDFIFFISSSFIRRFKAHESFKKYLDTTKMKLDESQPLEVHRVVLNYYRSLIPKNKEYYLAPFSIKKGSNIYGLIFGSGHSYGIEKFLRVCWKMDAKTGEANFDIDSDKIDIRTPALFEEMNIPKKLNIFHVDFKKAIAEKKILTNRDAYLYGLSYGVLPKHVNESLKKLLHEKIVSFNFKLQSDRIHKIIEPSPITLLHHGRI